MDSNLKKWGVSIYIPVYNEEKILEGNIKKIDSVIKRITKNYELIIVDDSSSDKTYEICKLLSRGNIKNLRFTNGPSRRENLAEAMKSANKGIVVYMDIDLATNLRHLKRLLQEIENNDIVIGSRYSGISAKRSFSRRFISICYNLVLRVFLGSKIKDHQCGFKAFKRDVLIELICEAGYDERFLRGWSWDAEILIRAQKKRLKIKEFPVNWISGKDSSFDLKREIKIISHLFGLRRTL